MGLFSGKRKSDGTFDMRTSGNKGRSSTVGGRIASGIASGIVGGIIGATSSSSNTSTFEEQEKKEKNMERQSFYDQKDEDLVKMDIPETEKELVDFMDYMISVIGLHGWSGSAGDETERKNALSDAAMAKIEMGLFKLNRLSSPYYPLYEKKFKVFKKKRIFKKYIIWLIFIIVLIVFGIAGNL